MKRVGLSFVLITCLILPVLGFEKLPQGHLDDEPEVLIGKVKKVITTGTWFKKVDEQLVKGESSSTTQKFSRNPKPHQPDSDDSDSDTEEGEEIYPDDPIKAQQSEGYNAGYGNSLGRYGFYKIDEKENILEAAHYNSDDKKLIQTDYYTYDADGKELQKITVKADGSLAERVITLYNSQGKTIESATYAYDGRLAEIWAWQYDEKNNPVLQTIHRKGFLEFREASTYRYDRKGNWIKKASVMEDFDKGKLASQQMHVSERIITYYEK